MTGIGFQLKKNRKGLFMGFLDKQLKKGLKKGMKEMGLKPKKHKKHKDKKHKDKKHKDYSYNAPPPPPPGRAPGYPAPPHQAHHAPPSQMHGGEVQMYIQQVQGWDGEARKKALKKLDKLFKKSIHAVEPHIAAIISLLGHQDFKVKQSISKLIRSGAKSAPMLFEPHLDTLQRLLNDPDPKVRSNLMDAVRMINSMLGGGGVGGTHVTNIYQSTPSPHSAPAPAHAAPPKPAYTAPPAPAHAAPLDPEPPSEVLETGKPGVHLDIIEEQLPYKRWGMIRLKVENHSEVDLYNITVDVKGPVELSPIDVIHHIPAGESTVLEIGMKAAEAGMVPAHLSAKYSDRARREYTHSRQDWVKVKKPDKGPQGTHINIGSIGDIVSDHSTKISDSVIQRSNIGGGGGQGGGGGGGSTVIRGSTVQRSNISGGSNVEVEDSVMVRSNIAGGGGGGGPPACPQCGRELKPEWAMCPKCGTKF